MTVVVAIITLFGAGIAPAGDIYYYYVASDGSDANPGWFESPFGTFNHAIAVAAPGDTIYVRGGTYRLDHRLLIDNAGTPDKPIHLDRRHIGSAARYPDLLTIGG